jgi:hypothetical protein
LPEKHKAQLRGREQYVLKTQGPVHVYCLNETIRMGRPISYNPKGRLKDFSAGKMAGATP